MARGSHTEHIEQGLALMRQLRAARAGQQEIVKAATAAPKHEGHCFGCKTKKTVLTEAVRASGVKGVKRHHGPCPDCGTTVSTFIGGAKEAK